MEEVIKEDVLILFLILLVFVKSELVTGDCSQRQQQGEHNIFRLCKFPLLANVKGDWTKAEKRFHPPPPALTTQ